MFESVRQWWSHHQRDRQAEAFAKNGTGFQAMVVPFTPTMAAADRTALAATVETWLAEQLTRTATPYGLTHYTVCLGYIQTTNGQRTLLHRWQQAMTDRTLASATFAAAADAIRHDAIPAATTALEVYLFSAGDVLKALLARKDAL